MTKTQDIRETQAKTLRYLQSLITPYTRIYAVLRHVSRSGLFRVISFGIIPSDPNYGDGKPILCDISWQVAVAIRHRYNSRYSGVEVTGAGMDMGYHLVSLLSEALFPGDNVTLPFSWF